MLIDVLVCCGFVIQLVTYLSRSSSASSFLLVFGMLRVVMHQAYSGLSPWLTLMYCCGHMLRGACFRTMYPYLRAVVRSVLLLSDIHVISR